MDEHQEDAKQDHKERNNPAIGKESGIHKPVRIVVLRTQDPVKSRADVVEQGIGHGEDVDIRRLAVEGREEEEIDELRNRDEEVIEQTVKGLLRDSPVLRIK